jgi:hypothetical protein
MIKYSLRCSNGHVFDEWFSSMADYDEKFEAGSLECPECGTKDVKKALMAPGVSTSGSLGKAQSNAGKAAQAKFGYCEGAKSCPAFGSSGCGCK